MSLCSQGLGSWDEWQPWLLPCCQSAHTQRFAARQHFYMTIQYYLYRIDGCLVPSKLDTALHVQGINSSVLQEYLLRLEGRKCQVGLLLMGKLRRCGRGASPVLYVLQLTGACYACECHHDFQVLAAFLESLSSSAQAGPGAAFHYSYTSRVGCPLFCLSHLFITLGGSPKPQDTLPFAA